MIGCFCFLEERFGFVNGFFIVVLFGGGGGEFRFLGVSSLFMVEVGGIFFLFKENGGLEFRLRV